MTCRRSVLLCVHGPYAKRVSLLLLLGTIILGGCNVADPSSTPATGAPYQLIRRFSQERGIIWSIAWSPDGKKIATGTELWPLNVWDLSTGSVSDRLVGGNTMVRSITWSPDNTNIATVSMAPSSTLRIWESSQEAFVPLVTSGVSARSISWSPDGKSIAIAVGDFLPTSTGSNVVGSSGVDQKRTNGSIEIRNARDWKLIKTLSLVGFADYVRWSPDGEYLLYVSTSPSGGPQAVTRWNISDGSILNYSVSHSDYINDISLSPDGNYFATASNDGTAKIWSIKSNTNSLYETILHKGQVLSVSWSPDSKKVATGSEDMTAKVWDVAQNALLATLEYPNNLDAIAWSPDGKYIAGGGHSNTIYIWSATP